MSKAQGDGYRTQTNEALNAYRDRLDAKLEKLYDTKEKWYHVGVCWILTKQSNILENPNGSWKWNGWEIVGKEYAITVYHEDDVTVSGDKGDNGDNGFSVDIHGFAIAREVFVNDRNKANECFKEFKRELE